jgi:hypothetical protein
MRYKVHPRAKGPNKVMGAKAPNGKGRVVHRSERPRAKEKEGKAKAEPQGVPKIMRNLGKVATLVVSMGGLMTTIFAHVNLHIKFGELPDKAREARVLPKEWLHHPQVHHKGEIPPCRVNPVPKRHREVRASREQALKMKASLYLHRWKGGK